MSSFFYCNGRSAHAKSAALRGKLSALGLPLVPLFEDETHSLLVHVSDHDKEDALLTIDEASFIFRTGMFFYKELSGSQALKSFYQDFDPQAPKLDETSGQFCLVIRKDGTLFFLTDQLGVNKIYHDTQETVFSNRFIGLTELIEAPSLDAQGCYEYAWNAKISGEKTFFQSIRMVPASTYIRANAQINFLSMPTWSILEDQDYEDVDGLIDLHVERLQSLFARYANWFGDGISLLMSGGYDSRLLLALLLDNGVRPHLLVFGGEQDAEARVVQEIGTKEALPFQRVDKSGRPTIAVEDYGDHLLENYALYDGWKFTGLFDNGGDTWDRKSQGASGLVKMNGSVGEIYRNFFYLPDGAMPALHLVRAFYARYDPKACTDRFSASAFENAVASDIKAAINAEQDRLTRTQVEMAYPLFRGRFWTARDVPTNQEFGQFLVPFMEPSIVKGTPNIPLSLKNHGRFEGRMIKRISPRLAAYMSDYGYAFSDDPPLSYIVKMQMTYQRPIAVRRFSYRIQHRRMDPARPYFLTQPYLKHVLPDADFPFMRQFFDIGNIRDREVFNRIATMEYICQRINARTS